MPRPPKPTKPIEYILDVKNIVDEDSGKGTLNIEIRTAREFQNFQYQLNMAGAFDPATGTITLRIGGVAVPAELMPGEGPAVGTFEIPSLKPGAYTITIKKPPKDVNSFAMKVTKTGVTVEEEKVVGRKFILVS